MSNNIATAKAWQRERALILHREFVVVDRAYTHEGQPLMKALAEAYRRLQGTLLCNGTFLRLGNLVKGRSGTLLRAWYEWQEGGKSAEALIQERKGFQPKIPAELVREFQRRCTLPGCAHYSVAINSILKDWREGKHIDGLGDRYEWCAQKGLPMDAVPEFPFSPRTFYAWKPKKAERALGVKGRAAMMKAASYVEMDYTKLRKCELFQLDDVRLDILCIDELTGRAIEVVCYILMEVASRSVVAWLAKPAAAIKQEDVDELVAYGLQCQGYGIGVDYVTHILFERGTVACSEAAKMALEGASEGRIKIHRTGMDGGVRWIGAPADVASGHANGKAVIESFNRKLHLALMHLAGQRGNKWENQPANLGYRGEDNIAPGSLAAEARKLDGFVFAAAMAGQRVRLKLSMLYFYELQTALRAAMETHNNEAGHDYAGHGQFLEAEVLPGVWKERE